MSDAEKKHVLGKVANRSAGEAESTAVLPAVQKNTG